MCVQPHGAAYVNGLAAGRMALELGIYRIRFRAKWLKAAIVLLGATGKWVTEQVPLFLFMR